MIIKVGKNAGLQQVSPARDPAPRGIRVLSATRTNRGLLKGMQWGQTGRDRQQRDKFRFSLLRILSSVGMLPIHRLRIMRSPPAPLLRAYPIYTGESIMSISPRVALAAMAIAGLSIAGCADKATTRSHTATSASSPTVVSPTGSSDRTRATRTTVGTRTVSDAGLPEQTGIAACDDYLSSYLACHRAAKIFAPDQLQDRYEAMRTNLLRDSQNPEIRPQLGERCNSLSRSLRQALHGKPCATNPATSSSTP